MKRKILFRAMTLQTANHLPELVYGLPKFVQAKPKDGKEQHAWYLQDFFASVCKKDDYPLGFSVGDTYQSTSSWRIDIETLEINTGGKWYPVTPYPLPYTPRIR